MNSTTDSSSGQVGECVPKGGSEALRGARGQPGREELDERPAQPGRHRLGEAGLAGAGRPEQDHRLGRRHAESLGHLGVGQRQHDPALDDLLLPLHAGHRLPEASGQDATTQLAEGRRVRGDQVLVLLEVRQSLPGRVATVVQRHRAGGVLGQQRANPPDAVRAEPAFQFGEQGATDAAAAPTRRQRDQQHPGPLALDLRDRQPDHLVGHDRDHRRWPARADAITSETGKTGRVPSACRLWSQTWMAWSRSSSWKSRNRHAGIPNPLGSSRSLTASGFGVDPETGVAPE